MAPTFSSGPTSGQMAQWACVAEVSARKAGNVHPGVGGSFSDCGWQEFMVSAMVCRPILDRVGELGVGQAVLSAASATREAVGVNTNLGILLLLAPLCVTVDRDALGGVLDGIDGGLMYQAIRLANPGGLGAVDDGDVHDAVGGGVGVEGCGVGGGSAKPQAAEGVGVVAGNVCGVAWMDAMRLSSDRDAIAMQYVNGFADVFDFVAVRLVEWYAGDGVCVGGGNSEGASGGALDRAIVGVHLEQMARQPDTLIARKCGQAVADESARRAQVVLDHVDDDFDRAFTEFDAWLRADGHRRNPGTSADLIAAGLYVAMARGDVVMPWRWDGKIEPAFDMVE